MARLYQGSITSVSVAGVEYRAGTDGCMEVPDKAAPALVAAFGFVHIEDEIDDAPKPKTAAAKAKK